MRNLIISVNIMNGIYIEIDEGDFVLICQSTKRLLRVQTKQKEYYVNKYEIQSIR